MIILDAEQGSETWLAARCAIPSASEFSKIYTSTGKRSTQAKSYMNQLLACWLKGGPVESFKSEWMARGTELEPDARSYYEFNCSADVDQVGFIYGDDRKLFGGSPDGLVGDDGLVEIKCPAPATHVQTLLDDRVPTSHVPQLQGLMLVTEREWIDFVSYCPDLPALIFRVKRDVGYINGLRSALDAFIDDMLAAREQLKEKGYEPQQEEGIGNAA